MSVYPIIDHLHLCVQTFWHVQIHYMLACSNTLHVGMFKYITCWHVQIHYMLACSNTLHVGMFKYIADMLAFSNTFSCLQVRGVICMGCIQF